MSEKGDGVLKPIVIAVLIALLVGGSAPWWWYYFFPKPSQRGTESASSPSPVASADSPKGVGACATGASPSNQFHDTAATNGSWDWNCDGKVEREFAVCENLSRKDCEPSTNQTGAAPGFCTELRGEGGCPPKLGDCGQKGFVYPCFYNAADGRCHAGGYETASVMRCK